jgi:hypothetical protein
LQFQFGRNEFGRCLYCGRLRSKFARRRLSGSAAGSGNPQCEKKLHGSSLHGVFSSQPVSELRDRRGREAMVRLILERGASVKAAASAATGNPSADRHSFHGKIQCRTGAHGYDLIDPFFQVVPGLRPTVFPQQRPDIEDAGAALVEVGFIVKRKLLNAPVRDPEVRNGPVRRPGRQTLRIASLRPAAYRRSHCQGKARSPSLLCHPDVVTGIGTPAATAVSSQQAIPAIVVYHVGRFTVDGEVTRLVARMKPFSVFG